ncbi:MAG: S8 family serine peptidase [Opitutaceae bacterium]
MLLIEMMVGGSFAYSASAPEAVTVQLDEPFFVEVPQAKRRDPSFIGDFRGLQSDLSSRGVLVDEIWAGESRLYPRVTLPGAAGPGRNATIEELQNLPLVEQVISNAAAPRALRDVHLLRKFDGDASIPEARPRGFREKRRDFFPDLTAPHTREILVVHLEENITPNRLEATRARVAQIHERLNAQIKGSVVLAGELTDIIEIPEEIDFEFALRAYLESEDIEYAQPNYIYQLDATPNDPEYVAGNMWGLDKISAPTAWNTRTGTGTGSGSVLVAVTDTGIDYNHLDLSANVVGIGYNAYADTTDGMDDTAGSHGTHVAGIIGAVGNNSLQVVGVAWQTRMLPVKIFNAQEQTNSDAVAGGLDYARTSGAHIVNASWGGGPYEPKIEQALSLLNNAGIIFVNSAGNSNSDNDAVIKYPGGYAFPNICQVNTGSQIAIGGIWIGGSGSKRVALRAWGPSLGQLGIPGSLPDPQITIHNSAGQQIGSNNDWGTLSQADKNELAANGLTPLHSLDSAWITTLAPGSYTVQLSGVGGVTGIGMVESWDIDGSNVKRLVNTSTRCYVGTGSTIAIGGPAISGDKPRQVYVRALGPTLKSLGVPGALQDTVITLHDSSGSPIASNDDWRSFDGSSTALENRLVQLGYPPPDNRESAIVMRLNPGTYTVHLSGKGGTTGVALLEFNEY